MEFVSVLQDGFWERTTVVRDESGELFVHKESTPAGADSPWGQTALREEIRFLGSVPAQAHPYYPPLQESWDDQTTGRVGYRIPFYPDYENVSAALRRGALSQDDADQIQAHLADAVVEATHQPAPASGFVDHLLKTIEKAFSRLRELPEFATCIDAPEISINGVPLLGLASAYERARTSPAMATLKALPSVCLHGDLILENILWNPSAERPLLLLDPVSVAGIWHGPAAFDLVKYASYASGELYALRSGAVRAGPDSQDSSSFHYQISLPPAFTHIDLQSSFNQAFEKRHGARDPRIEHLHDGYFSLVMAVNTTGPQQWARVLKGILALNAAAVPVDLQSTQ